MKINKEKKVNSESQVSTLYSHPKIKDSLCELPARKGPSINDVSIFFPDLCTSLSAGASFFVLSFGNFYQFLTPSQLPMSFMDGPQPKHSIQTRQLSYAEQN